MTQSGTFAVRDREATQAEYLRYSPASGLPVIFKADVL
jgi:hypothetical protein